MWDIIHVFPQGNLWKVRCEHGQEIKRTEAAAIKRAKQHVAALSRGMLAQILIQSDFGLPRTEWAHGQYPYPQKN